MSVYRSPNSPYWQYDFQFKHRRFHGSTGCTAKRDAEAYERNARRDAALGNAARQPISLTQACNLYWEEKGKYEASHATTDYQLANLCEGIGKAKLLSDIRLSHLRTYCDRRRQEVSNASVNREWQLARRVWKHARGSGFAVPASDDDNAIDWSELALPEPKERTRELLAAEETRLFRALVGNPDLAAVAEFAMLSGQRRTSVVTLELDRVDFDGMRATIIGKGDIEHTFPLTPRMAEIIRQQWGCDGMVFSYFCQRPAPARRDRPARRRGQRYPFTKQGWAREWRAALRDAKIRNFRFHDLRHTAATRLLRDSGNLKAAQKLLNHADISTTARYAHVLEDDLRAMMNAQESRNSPVQPLTTASENRRISKENEEVQ